MLLSVLWGVATAAEPIRLWDLEFVPQGLPVASHEKSVASADVNQDGFLDLIVLQRDQNNAAVHLGDAGNIFRPIGQFAAGHDPTHFTIADINQDGQLDLVIANHETSYVTLLLGDGHGSFAKAPNSPQKVDVDPHPHIARIADLNGDDIGDLIVDSRAEFGVRILEGAGKGEFKDSGKLVSLGGDPYLGVAIGDVNGDKLPDLISPNERSVGIALNGGSGDGAFLGPQSIPVGYPFAVELLEIDGDGNLDLVVATDGQESRVEILKGDGRGGFERLASARLMPRGAKGLAAGDMSGDGVDDFVATSWSSNEILIVGGREPRIHQTVVLDDIENPWGTTIADLNGDGYGDLVIADGIKPVARIYMSRSAAAQQHD